MKKTVIAVLAILISVCAFITLDVFGMPPPQPSGWVIGDGNTQAQFPAALKSYTVADLPTGNTNDLVLATDCTAADDCSTGSGSHVKILVKTATGWVIIGDGSASGAGDVGSVGDCSGGACLDGTSDGGEWVRLYDGDSHYVQLDVGDLSANITVNLPTASGTLLTTALAEGYVWVGSAGGIATATDSSGWDKDASNDYTAGGTDVALADGGTGASLSDPNAHRFIGWDDTDGAVKWWTLGDGLSYNAATDTVSATGSGDITAVGPGYASGAAFSDGVVSSGATMFIWEGSTDDGNEFTVAAPSDDPAADITVTFPGETGTLMVGPAGFAADNILAKTDGTGNKFQATGITVDDSNNMSGIGTIGSGAVTSSGALKGTSIILEGGANDTTLQAGTPAAAITYTFPSNTGIEGQYLQLGSSNTMQWGDPAGSGTITAVGNFASGASFTQGDTQNGILYFEGSTANDFEIAFTAANATADRTITLPDETGTVMLGPAGLGTDNRLMKTDGTGNVVQITGITVDDSNNVSGVGTLGLTGAVTISANSAAITHSGTTTLAVTSTSGTVSVESVTFTGDAITGAASLAASSHIALGADPADAGSIRLPNAGYVMAEADAAGTDISVIGVDSSEVIQIGASGASGVTITPATTITGHVTLEGVTSTGATGTGKLVFDTAPVFTTSIEAPFLILGTAASAADAGAIRLPNAAYIYAEADAAGTDISVIGVDSAEVVQIAASGASGVTITPDTTITGALTVNGNGTFGNEDTDTLTLRSLLVGGNSRAVQIAGSYAERTYATGTNELYVAGDIETPATVYAAAINTGTGTDGTRAITMQNNADVEPTASGNKIYFYGNVLKVVENGTAKDVPLPADSVTWTGATHSFAGVTNLVLPTAAPDAGGEIGINTTNHQLIYHDGAAVIKFDTTSVADGKILKYSSANSQFEIADDATGSSPTLNSIGNPTADTTITFDATEQLVWDFSGAYSSGTQFLIQQTGSLPSGGVLFEVNTADSQVTAVRVGDGTNYLAISSTGGVSHAGTSVFTAPRVATSIAPSAADGATLGTAALEFSDLYLANGGVIYFQNDQSVYLTPSAGTLTLTGALVTSGAVSPSVANGAALGSATAEWADLFLHDGAIIYGQADQSATLTSSASTWTASNFGVTGDLTVGDDLSLTSDGAVINIGAGNDVTITHSANTLTLGGGNLALGSNNLTMTGSIADTGNRVTKGWFTDLEVTNAIAGSVTGTAASLSGSALPTNSTVGTSIAIGADPADAGAIRLSNAGYIYSEADAAGTDISVIGVDSSEVIQIGASGASGVTITPATTITGAITSSGGITVADSQTITFDESAANPDDADVVISATDGVFKIAAANGANNEDITIDVDQTANTVIINSSTGVTDLYSALPLRAPAKFLSYDAAQTLTAAAHNGAIVMMTVAGEVTMWDCTASTIGHFVTLWARDAEKIEVVPATDDQFYLFDGTGIGANDVLDIAATAGTKVTLMCTAANEWRVVFETAACADGGAAD